MLWEYKKKEMRKGKGREGKGRKKDTTDVYSVTIEVDKYMYM